MMPLLKVVYLWKLIVLVVIVRPPVVGLYGIDNHTTWYRKA